MALRVVLESQLVCLQLQSLKARARTTKHSSLLHDTPTLQLRCRSPWAASLPRTARQTHTHLPRAQMMLLISCSLNARGPSCAARALRADSVVWSWCSRLANAHLQTKRCAMYWMSTNLASLGCKGEGGRGFHSTCCGQMREQCAQATMHPSVPVQSSAHSTRRSPVLTTASLC
eukprot:1149495-Pelagomonas_calceolata.AAC.9